MRTEKADIMPSCNLETKTDTKTRMGYTRETESRSTKSSHEGLATGFGWRLSKLSGRLHPKVPRGGCTSWLLAPGPTIPKVRSKEKGRAVSGCPRWLQEHAGYGASLCRRTESHQRHTAWLPGPGEKKRSIQFLRSSPSLRFREENAYKFLSGLQFLSRLIFYCWAWTMKQSSFLFFGANPPLLRNLSLNCQKGTFKLYKLASLKMLKHLWKHSHFILSFIKSWRKKNPKLPCEAKLAERVICSVQICQQLYKWGIWNQD